MKTRLIVAWLGNLIDTIATVYLTSYCDGMEINPISAVMLEKPFLFILVKVLMMTISAIFIWRFRDRPFFKVTSWMLFVEYLAVAIYYACIFYTYNLI